MNDYSPPLLARKWGADLPALLAEQRALWQQSRPQRRFYSFGVPSADARDDQMTPNSAKKALLYDGEIVWALAARAFFASYVPGRKPHYGSVVYGLDSHEPDSVFELAWQVNQLRESGAPPPPADAQPVANAMQDDRSNFARIRLPESLEALGESYLANLCIHRSRLPTGYLHDRLLPILVAPEKTEWCCLLPLAYWLPRLQQIWASGPPAYEPHAFDRMLTSYGIEP